MNRSRWTRLALAAATPLALAGCSSSPRIWVAPSNSPQTPVSVPGMVGYLNTGSSGIDYLQWQTGSGGSIQGTELDASASGDIPNEQVSVSRGSFEGQTNGQAVTISTGIQTQQGTLSGGILTLNVVQPDGTIESVVYHRASDADYNSVLGKFKTSVQQANARQSLANDQADAERKVAEDYQAVLSDESSLKGDVSSLQGDVASTGTDLSSEHSDERNVLTEAHNGTDNSSVCGDASSVGGDASSVAGDASGISGDLQGVSNDLSTLHSDASTLTADLTSLLRIEPDYTGQEGEPSPSTVRQVGVGAASAASKNVQSANGDIDQENSDVATAYGYATDASAAGGCDLPPASPAPIKHISSPSRNQNHGD